MVVTFDLFSTLVDAGCPSDPGSAVADAPRKYGVTVPDDRDDAHREVHISVPKGAEVLLLTHVAVALRSRGVDSPDNAARHAIITAFDPEMTARPGAVDAVATAHGAGAVGLLPSCSVPKFATRVLIRSDLDRHSLDDITTSVAYDWRKPHRQVFEAMACGLGVNAAELLHVGDDSDADSGIEAVSGRFVNLRGTTLKSVAARLRIGEGPCP